MDIIPIDSFLNEREIQASAILALACYSAGDASGFQEWYEPLLAAKVLSGLYIILNLDNVYVITGTDYSNLSKLPQIAVLYHNEWIGSSDASEDYRFVIDEFNGEQVVFEYTSQVEPTEIFD